MTRVTESPVRALALLTAGCALFACSAAHAAGPSIAPIRLTVVGSRAQVTNGRAHFRMRCTGGEALLVCPGRVVVRARLRRGSPAVSIGHASVDIAEGAARSISVPLSRAARARLRGSPRLAAVATARPSSGDPATRHRLVVVAASAAAAAKKRCSFKRAHAVSSNATARLFYFTDPDNPGDRDYGGCLFRRGVALYLEHDGSDVEGVTDEIDDPTLAGHYFAAGAGLVGDGGTHRFEIELFDLRREHRFDNSGLAPGEPFHHTAQRVAAVPAVDGLPATGHSDVTALVLAGSGAVAWIGEDMDTGRYEVHALAGHKNTLLDSGPDIAPSQLSLSGHTLEWSRAGTTKTATLG